MASPMDFTSPVKSAKKHSKPPIKSILSPDTLDRIARPRRYDLSPSPFPINVTSHRHFKSTPKKRKLSTSVRLLNRLQKTEVSIKHPVPSKKMRKTNLQNRKSASISNSQLQKTMGPPVVKVHDGAEVQVPATPIPKRT